jgi:glycosyltransferase involved in cell wall biosynthesis
MLFKRSDEQSRSENEMKQKPLLCFIMTSPYCMNAFLLGHFQRLAREFRILVLLNVEHSEFPILPSSDFEVRHIALYREIAPWHDLLALFRLIGILWKLPAIAVISLTPKGGLLAMIAAWCARVPVRIHYFTGQVWATTRGAKRILLKSLDQLLSRCATALLTDSASQRAFLLTENISHPNKLHVLGEGSVCGVDLQRFAFHPQAREKVRVACGIPMESTCLLYIGRMTREKGVGDLLQAYHLLKKKHPSLHLLLVGPDEGQLLQKLSDVSIHPIGYTAEVESYMSAADILCLPSYREGFGNVLIEAAAVGLPCVASRIYGITDALVEGETGLLHEAGDVQEIASCLSDLLSHPQKCERLGNAGRKRVVESFSTETVENSFYEFLQSAMEKKPVSRAIIVAV